MSKILVIEDNKDVRENIEEILDLSGYEVQAAENGKVGVKKAIDFMPDLILCDIMMPELDGYGVLHMLSRNVKTHAIPFIFLTAKAEMSDIRKGMKDGADDYITKPFEELDLLESIESRLQRKKALEKIVEKGSDVVEGLSGLGDGLAELKDLIKSSNKRTYGKRETVFQEGNNPHYVYLLDSGSVKVSKMNADGKEFTTQVAGSGDLLGTVAALKSEPYDATATCLEKVQCFAIPVSEFQLLVASRPAISSAMIQLMARSLSMQEDELLSLAYNSVRKRVALALVKLHDKQKSSDHHQVNTSREDIAQLAGTATESAIRILTEFKEDGLISSEGRTIIVHDREALINLPY